MSAIRLPYLFAFFLNITSLALLVVARWADWLTNTDSRVEGPLRKLSEFPISSAFACLMVWLAFVFAVPTVLLSLFDALALTEYASPGLKTLLVFVRVDFSLSVCILLGTAVSLFFVFPGSSYTHLGHYGKGFWAALASALLQLFAAVFQGTRSLRKGFLQRQAERFLYKDYEVDDKKAVAQATESEMARIKMDEEFKVDLDKEELEVDASESEN